MVLLHGLSRRLRHTLIIVLLFVYLIAKDVSRSKFYRRQLEKPRNMRKTYWWSVKSWLTPSVTISVPCPYLRLLDIPNCCNGSIPMGDSDTIWIIWILLRGIYWHWLTTCWISIASSQIRWNSNIVPLMYPRFFNEIYQLQAHGRYERLKFVDTREEWGEDLFYGRRSYPNQTDYQ